MDRIYSEVYLSKGHKNDLRKPKTLTGPSILLRGAFLEKIIFERTSLTNNLLKDLETPSKDRLHTLNFLKVLFKSRNLSNYYFIGRSPLNRYFVYTSHLKEGSPIP